MPAVEEMIEDSISQDNYEPTPYVDASWEVVGELVETKEFAPMEVPVLPSTARFADPMFADYGGIPEDEHITRWHLPAELSAEETQKRLRESQEPEVPMVTMTVEEFEALKQEAFQSGQIAGMESAVDSNAEKMAQAEQRMLEVFADLEKQLAEHQDHTQKKAIELALQISQKIIHHTVDINPEYIIPIVQQGLNLASTSKVTRIRVSKQDLEFVQLLGVAKNLKSRDQSWEFIADETINAGCVLETTAGEIDFQVDQAWERIKDQVIKVLR